MAIEAKIKFVQGATIGTAGVSLIGTLSTPVDVSNGDDTSVQRWIWRMIDTPPGSAVPVGLVSDGLTSTFQFVPDVRGGYEVELTIFDASGTQRTDRRVFQVLEESGRLIPPFSADAPALNFLGQTRGWAPYMEAYLEFVDLFSTAGATVPMTARRFTQNITGGRVDYDLTSTTTPDATPVEIYRYPIPTGSLCKFDWVTTASGAAEADSATFAQSITYRREGSNAPAVIGAGVPDDMGSRPAVPFVSYPAVSIDGNDLVVTATGSASAVRWVLAFQATIGFDPT